MNPEVVDLIVKGLTLLPALVAAGIAIEEKVAQLVTLIKSGDNLTPAEIAQIRAEFDADLDDFNTPMS